MKAIVIYVVTTNSGKLAVCEAQGEQGFVVFSVQKGGPWKGTIDPKRAEEIEVEDLQPTGDGIMVPASASPLPAKPPARCLVPGCGYQLNRDGSCTGCLLDLL